MEGSRLFIQNKTQLTNLMIGLILHDLQNQNPNIRDNTLYII